MSKPAKFLACDMDGTIIPLSDLERQREALQRFKEKSSNTPNLRLGYVTGRHLELGLQGVKEHDLPEPHVFVCDVGTNIYFRNKSHWQRDESYADKLRGSWNNQGETIQRLLKNVLGLQSQEDEKQGEFKKSYYADPKLSEKEIRQHVGAILRVKEIKANLIYSYDRIKRVGLLDILPPMAAKDSALHHIVASLQLGRDKVFYAGDSGNDLLAFLSGYHAILVANTDDTT
ncbi:MAG: HAD-IIB family hydrolase, partial [Deltaproteobacteria bacterium]